MSTIGDVCAAIDKLESAAMQVKSERDELLVALHRTMLALEPFAHGDPIYAEDTLLAKMVLSEMMERFPIPAKRGQIMRFNDVTGTIHSCLDEAFNEIDALHSEMDDWASNMESTNLASTEKCSLVREAADALGNVSRPDVSKEIAELEVKYQVAVSSKLSRADRRDTAVSQLNAVMEVLEDREDDDEARSLLEDIDDIKNEIEGVEFPGMYG